MYKQLRSRIGALWCGLAHDSVMWPVHGHYKCRTCGRRYPAFTEAPTEKQTRHGALKPAMPLMLALILLPVAHPANGADVFSRREAASEAEAALARYTAGGEVVSWAMESIEIHAALPGLDKTGRLRAIRRPAPGGDTRYEVLQVAGDRTVKPQVVIRYLNARERAEEMPAASVAITPANYKFTYKNTVDDGEHRAYVFQITPLRKRDGLLKGEFWLDQHTGLPIRRSGRLVKSPSLFIRQVTVIQEDAVHYGVVESRLTHITVATPLVGRAELVIEERPLTSVDSPQFSTFDERGQQ